MTDQNITTKNGWRHPLGATPDAGGVNFSIFSYDAREVELMVSQGVPMICGGDEVRRTQRGNNNPYCQDNEVSWFDWSLTEKNREMLRFCQRMIDFRKRNRALRRSDFFKGEKNSRGLIDIAWHGCRLWRPGWGDPNSRALGFTPASSKIRTFTSC